MREFDVLDAVGLVLTIATGVILLSLLNSCTSAPVNYKRGALEDQVLQPLPGHTGLVNTQCTHDPKSGACVWDYLEYDLKDTAIRQRLRDAGFICVVSGRAYRIASLKPGLIFEAHDQSCLFGVFCGPKTEREVDYIPIDSYQSLIDQKTTCISQIAFQYYERGHL